MKQKIDALRSRLQQLQARHEQGELDAEAFAQARAPIERELVTLVMADKPSGAATTQTTSSATATLADSARPSRTLVATVLACIVLLAVLGYGLTGSPRLALSGPEQSPSPAVANGAAPSGQDGVPSEEQVREMVARLAERLQQNPDDLVGWTMLARAYTVMGQPDDAINAFRKALALDANSAGLMADLADALAAKNNGDLSGEPTKLVQRALAIEPDNLKVLALSGSIAFDRRDFAAAVSHWEKVERALPRDSGFLGQVHSSITQARELGGMPPPRFDKLANAGNAETATPATASSGMVAGTVSLAASLKASAAPDDTVFIVARAVNGQKMPLAVVRKQVKDLPFEFKLDDSMAMAPTARISDHQQLVVIARISKSGDAMPQPGDLSGESAPVAPGVAGISIEINQKLSATGTR